MSVAWQSLTAEDLTRLYWERDLTDEEVGLAYGVPKDPPPPPAPRHHRPIARPAGAPARRHRPEPARERAVAQVIYHRGRTCCALCGKVMHTRWNYYSIEHSGRTVFVHCACSSGYLMRQGLPWDYPRVVKAHP